MGRIDEIKQRMARLEAELDNNTRQQNIEKFEELKKRIFEGISIVENACVKFDCSNDKNEVYHKITKICSIDNFAINEFEKMSYYDLPMNRRRDVRNGVFSIVVSFECISREGNEGNEYCVIHKGQWMHINLNMIDDFKSRIIPEEKYNSVKSEIIDFIKSKM